MAADKIPEPNDDAYDKGFLNKEYATKVVKKVNRPIKVVASNFPQGVVREAKEDVMIDLGPMLGMSQQAYIIVNGELVFGAFAFRKLAG